MTQQVINIGAAEDDDTGDHNRVAWDKTNQNFTELYGLRYVDASGTPTVGQYAKWVTAVTIQGVAPATVLSDIGAQPAGSYQPLDTELTAIAGLTSAADQAPYFTGSGAAALMTVTTAARTVLDDTTVGAMLTTLGGLSSATAATTYAPLASPTFTGDPKAPTPTAGDNDTSVATTAFVTTAIAGKADTSALASYALLASPTFTGDPKAPTPATADNDTSIATTAYVQAQGYLTSAAATAAYQPLDADLTSLAAAAGTNTIYYRNGINSWAAVNVSTGLSFSGGNLTATGGGGDVFKAAANAFTNLNTFTGSLGVIIGHTAQLGFDLEVHAAGRGATIDVTAWINSAAGPSIDLDKSRGATVGTHTVVASGDNLGEIYFRGSNGATFAPAGSIKAIANGTPSGGFVPGALQLSTTNAAGSSVLCGSISPGACNFIGDVAGGGGAPTGYVGEYLTATATANLALTSGAYTSVCTLSLPPGDWDVRGTARVNGPAGSYMYMTVYTVVNSSSGSADSTQTGIFTALGDCWTSVGPFRVSISAYTNHYLNIYVATAGCVAVTSQIQARRRH